MFRPAHTQRRRVSGRHQGLRAGRNRDVVVPDARDLPRTRHPDGGHDASVDRFDERARRQGGRQNLSGEGRADAGRALSGNGAATRRIPRRPAAI